MLEKYIELVERIIETQSELNKKMDAMNIQAKKISYELALLKNGMGVDNR